MRGDLRWGPLYAECSQCNQYARVEVDTTVHPHLAGKIGVRCSLCSKGSVYQFQPTVDGEMAAQASRKAKADAYQAKLAQEVAKHGHEEWPLFQAAMFGLMPQPAEPEPFTPSPRTLFVWQLMKAEGRGPLDHLDTEEDHGSTD